MSTEDALTKDVLSAATLTESVETSTSTAVPLREPREGLPPVLESSIDLKKAADLLRAGTGPVALDAERASGFRYSGRAYLVQLRREGAGTILIDPIAVDTLRPIHDALEGVDWILHAASQDLVCLRELHLYPTAELFDTELAGRLLGLPRVGLGSLVENHLGYLLAKEHSAADWSTRPLPESWLNYAALDVELLIELWDVMRAQLVESNKYEWALEEFAHVRQTTNPIVREDPWRRTSGIHKIKKPRQLAVVRELWQARDALAAAKDIATGRLLPDRVLAELGQVPQSSVEHYLGLPVMKNRGIQRNIHYWRKAIDRALTMPESDLPDIKKGDGNIPAPRLWSQRNPEKYSRWSHARAHLIEHADKLHMPVENLVSPDVVKKIFWNLPEDETGLTNVLADTAIRSWQWTQIEHIIRESLWSVEAEDYQPAKTEEPTDSAQSHAE